MSEIDVASKVYPDPGWTVGTVKVMVPALMFTLLATAN